MRTISSFCTILEFRVGDSGGAVVDKTASGGRCILHPITQENNGVRESELLCGM